MKKLTAFYFSGTGNTRFVTEKLCERLSADFDTKIYDISGNKNYFEDIKAADVLLLAFPIYGSSPPVPMRRFVYNNEKNIKDKEVIIVATQYLFSGDGAASLGRTVEKFGGRVIYAEHFNMPSNIADFPFPKIRNGQNIGGKLKKAEKRIAAFAQRISEGKTLRRGFNPFSHAAGYYGQRKWWRKGEQKKKNALRIDAERCVGCGICGNNCPVKNIRIENGRAVPRGSCVFCYRCVNACPKKAIILFGKNAPDMQYRGPEIAANFPLTDKLYE